MFYSASAYSIRLCILILCTSYFSDAGYVNRIDNIPGNTTRYRRQTTKECEFKFRCASGECINEELQCDGKENCKDGSDENVCDNIPCPPRNFFKCSYGACINKHLVCNGNRDCKDNSDETTPDCVPPVVTTPPNSGSCSSSQFQCDSGDCIADNLLCDGTANCPDNSDETVKHCSTFRCPRTTYRCRYGACVNKNAKCNKIVECFDGSDEDDCGGTKPIDHVTPTVVSITTTTPAGPPPPGSCRMPSNPANGQYTIGSAAVGSFKPGSYVSAFSPLRVICSKNYKATPPEKGVAFCNNGVWFPEPATCSLSCMGVNSTKTTKVSCTYKQQQLQSCMEAVENTVATIACEPLHEESGVKENPFRICRDGSWDRPFTQCYPVCGIKRPKGTPNIINGVKAEKGDYPWHVGIYSAKDKQNLCGGSIISERVVISAAHCFTDFSGGAKYPKENYLIAAGKYYRIYDDPRDLLEQHATIDDIYIPERYKGDLSQYAGDLAVVVLKNKLILSKAVQPVCIDWHTAFEYEQISGHSRGVVVGWGQTVEGAEPSLELKELNVPVIPYDQCFEQVPKSFRRFLTHDKVCAGFLGNATAACQGDSGGGLTFPDINDRYYLRGIVSTSPATVDGTCDSNQYGTYTLLSKHIDFIKLYGL